MRNLITFENGKPIINKINKDIQKANKILNSDARLDEQAEQRYLTSSLLSGLMSNPVTLRTRDSKNRQYHEDNLYDKSQVDKFNQHKSPFTRRDIIQIVQQKKKKQEILEFVDRVIEQKEQEQKKQTKNDQKKIYTPHKYNLRKRKKK